MAIDKVLIVEKDAEQRQFLCGALSELGYEAQAMAHPKEGKEQDFDLIFCDAKDFEFFRESHTLIVSIVPFNEADRAIDTIQQGAYNYLLKPFTREAIDTLLRKAEQHLAVLRENEYLRCEISEHSKETKYRIIAESPLMKRILEDGLKIAKSNASVMISGESGAGKEVIAHAIHYHSLRAKEPFVKVNCAAIPESLIESEFFGHEKGAFTGAFNKRVGRFELANGGTLLLDEISEIPLLLQSKLLRAIQEQEFERVGGTRTLKVDVRIIATSNRNMKEAVDKKHFREDLYYRLNVVPIHIPPLRERKEDILPLAEYFLEELCTENKKNKKSLSEEARQKLLAYQWPGNIRELANIIERTVVMESSDEIAGESLKLDMGHILPQEKSPAAGGSYPLGLTLDEVEKRHILETLAAHNNNRTRAARALGISIRTLRNKLNEYKPKESPQ